MFRFGEVRALSDGQFSSAAAIAQQESAISVVTKRSGISEDVPSMPTPRIPGAMISACPNICRAFICDGRQVARPYVAVLREA